jgi:PPOX class probable F420-dependent enzyme
MTAPSLQELAAERYVSLVTFRRNGNAVPTPIWVAAYDGRLYAVTNGTSVKMKRLKANDRIRLAACDARGKVRGEWAEGHGKRLDDAALIQRAQQALESKYGWQVSVLKFFSSLFGRAKHRTFIEMTIP